MSTDSEDSNDNDELNMSILTTQNCSVDEDHLGFFDRVSTSFVKRDTRYFKLVPSENKKIKRGYEEFCTGSSYIGEWNAFGFCGQGTYIYPHGVEYEGHFNKVGQFHGLGTLTYPNGQKMHGVWKNGTLFEYAYVFNCGEELDENYTYCQMPDRRFHVEIKKYFGPSGQEYLTADQPTKEIPKGCYDTVDGIYDPKYKFIFSHEPHFQEVSDYFLALQVEPCKRKLTDEFLLDGRIIQEIPTEEKIKWIKSHCRRAWDEPTRYRPDLYENWNTGRKNDLKYYETVQQTSSIIKVRKVHDQDVKEKEGPKLFTFIKKVKKPYFGRFSVFGTPRSAQS